MYSFLFARERGRGKKGRIFDPLTHFLNVTTVEALLDWAQELGTQYGSPRRETSTQVFQPSLDATQDAHWQRIATGNRARPCILASAMGHRCLRQELYIVPNAHSTKYLQMVKWQTLLSVSLTTTAIETTPYNHSTRVQRNLAGPPSRPVYSSFRNYSNFIGPLILGHGDTFKSRGLQSAFTP